ncbi:MAG TPA: metal-dependent transcriptional regulator [Bacteroidota bacterium]|nr:metal-dependent transcriptional regulator [Bacteroidota bacterium]
MNSSTEENYLKALFSLSGKSGGVNVIDLSKKLGIKMPTVTSMVKKLSQKKLIDYKKYKPLHLTAKGRKEALLIIRKHRLTEMFLVEKMGFGWQEVHKVAEQLEHVQIPVLFERMDEMLNFPKFDPHGEPIPDQTGLLKQEQYDKLSNRATGETVVFCAVENTTDDFLEYLNNREIRLGLKLKIHGIEPFDGSMLVSYGKRQAERLSHTICERLLVRKT